ncbi:MAG: hypothetical protein ACQEXQ_16075 [Bacillota bacterium]
MKYSNVFILEAPSTRVVGMIGPIRLMMHVDKSKEIWSVLFRKNQQRWVLTNDLIHYGLNVVASETELIGYGEDMNSALFVVWEHQKELGLDRTILDELKEQRKGDHREFA